MMGGGRSGAFARVGGAAQSMWGIRGVPAEGSSIGEVFVSVGHMVEQGLNRQPWDLSGAV